MDLVLTVPLITMLVSDRRDKMRSMNPLGVLGRLCARDNLLEEPSERTGQDRRTVSPLEAGDEVHQLLRQDGL